MKYLNISLAKVDLPVPGFPIKIRLLHTCRTRFDVQRFEWRTYLVWSWRWWRRAARDRFKLKFQPGLRTHLATAFDHQLFGDARNGNGRLAVNAVEGALRCLAERVMNDGTCDSFELIPVDFGVEVHRPAAAA